MTQEDWKLVEGFPDYKIFRNGEVVRISSGKTLTHVKNQQGSVSVFLTNKNVKGQKMVYLHKLLALAFLENPQGLPFVGFKDEDKRNISLDNLYWRKAGGRGNKSHPTDASNQETKDFVELSIGGRLYRLTKEHKLLDHSHRLIRKRMFAGDIAKVMIGGIYVPMAVIHLIASSGGMERYVEFLNGDITNHRPENLIWAKKLKKTNYKNVLSNPLWFNLWETENKEFVTCVDDDISIWVSKNGVFHDPKTRKDIKIKALNIPFITVGGRQKRVALLLARTFLSDQMDGIIGYQDIFFLDRDPSNVSLDNMCIVKPEWKAFDEEKSKRSTPFKLLKPEATKTKIVSGKSLAVFWGNDSKEILRIDHDGGIYVRGKLIEKDIEVVDGLRELLKERMSNK